MSFVAVILLLIYVIFFGIWLFFFINLIEKKESKEKYVLSMFLFFIFTYTVSFIVLEIPN